MKKLDNVLQNIKVNVLADDKRWLDSKYGWIKFQSNKKVGAIGEEIAKGIYGDCVPPISKDHDFIFAGRKKEVKTATMAIKQGTFTFFQIRQFQDVNDYVFICITPEKIEIWEVSKKDLLRYICEKEKGVIVAGGKGKRKVLEEKHGKEWMKYNDLFHYKVRVDDKEFFGGLCKRVG